MIGDVVYEASVKRRGNALRAPLHSRAITEDRFINMYVPE